MDTDDIPDSIETTRITAGEIDDCLPAPRQTQPVVVSAVALVQEPAGSYRLWKRRSAGRDGNRLPVWPEKSDHDVWPATDQIHHHHSIRHNDDFHFDFLTIDHTTFLEDAP